MIGRRAVLGSAMALAAPALAQPGSVRRPQRRAAGFARGLTVGVYDDFCMTAMKPDDT